MLPPVPKIPAADAAYGASATPTPRGQQKEVAQPQASNATPGNGSSLFARAAIASLASEFQLSRSTAILAETLGKLMNLPRQDGEAIQAYVVRLTDAIRALPAPQRLALEQQVAKVLQGLSLSMLAEILKQPTGPDAARLALLIELSRYKGMDLAAKAVVSSYQQNNSANPTPAQPPPPKAQTPQGQNAESRPNAAAAAQLSNAQTTGRLLSQFISLPALGAAAVKAMATAQPALPDLRTNLPAAPTDLPDSSPEAARADGKAESAARPPQLQTGNAAKEGTVPAETHASKSPRAENAETRPALPLRDMVKAEQKDARTALLQPSGQPAGDARDMENLLLAALTGKLPARATARTQPAATPPGIPPQQPEEQPAEKTASAMAAARPSGEETETVANRPEAQPLPRAAIDPEARMAMLEQSASQSLIAAALAKEGTPLPLVAYPPAEDDHESESPHRGSGPFSEEEAEGEPEGENPGAQDEAEERVAANDETDEPEAASDDSAENYYLRMSGML